MKILTIGNSFSEDATRYLQKIADGKLVVRNLYIGGCSLEQHYNNIKEAAVNYDYEIDAEPRIRESINHAITLEDWDYVTIQQVSHFSGMPETYEPYMEFIVNYIKEQCPRAKIAFHRTWAYDDLSDHGGFANYDRDRKTMYNKIVETTEFFAKKYNLPLIKSGDAVEKIRDTEEFKPITGKLNINRDGFHLSLDYGRYLAGLVWYKFFTGDDPKNVKYAPEGTDEKIIALLKEVASEIE